MACTLGVLAYRPSFEKHHRNKRATESSVCRGTVPSTVHTEYVQLWFNSRASQLQWLRRATQLPAVMETPFGKAGSRSQE